MNVSQSLAFQALSNVCISRRFSSTPIPKIHLVDYDCLAVQLLLVFFVWPLLGFCKVRTTFCFTFPAISSLIAHARFPSLCVLFYSWRSFAVVVATRSWNAMLGIMLVRLVDESVLYANSAEAV